MSEVGVEIVKTEETKEGRTKYFNINVSNSEVERNPDIVRLYSDAGTLEYVKPKADVVDRIKAEIKSKYESIPDTFHHYETGFTDALEWVLSIIDKYKAEGSEKE